MGSAVLQSRNLPKLLVVIDRGPRTRRRALKMDRLSFRNIRNKVPCCDWRQWKISRIHYKWNCARTILHENCTKIPRNWTAFLGMTKKSIRPTIWVCFSTWYQALYRVPRVSISKLRTAGSASRSQKLLSSAIKIFQNLNFFFRKTGNNSEVKNQNIFHNK